MTDYSGMATGKGSCISVIQYNISIVDGKPIDQKDLQIPTGCSG